MANENLKGLKVAILVEDGFEQVELTDPRKALDQAGRRNTDRRPRANVFAAGTLPTGVTSSRWTSRSTERSRAISTRCCCQAAS